jgi:predicted secreted protein
MRWYSMLAIFVLVWTICAFVNLPLGIRTHEEAGEAKIPGQADSAPANFRPLRVVLRTTIMALAICVLLFLNYQEGWVTPQQLDLFGQPAGFATGVG